MGIPTGKLLSSMQEIYKQLSLSIGAQIREVMDYPILIKYVTIDTANHDKK